MEKKPTTKEEKKPEQPSIVEEVISGRALRGVVDPTGGLMTKEQHREFHRH